MSIAEFKSTIEVGEPARETKEELREWSIGHWRGVSIKTNCWRDQMSKSETENK